MLVTGSTTVYDQIGLINRFTGRLPVARHAARRRSPGRRQRRAVDRREPVEARCRSPPSMGSTSCSARSRPATIKVGLVSTPDIAISFRRAREIDLLIPFSFFGGRDLHLQIMKGARCARSACRSSPRNSPPAHASDQLPVVGRAGSVRVRVCSRLWRSSPAVSRMG